MKIMTKKNKQAFIVGPNNSTSRLIYVVFLELSDYVAELSGDDLVVITRHKYGLWVLSWITADGEPSHCSGVRYECFLLF